MADKPIVIKRTAKQRRAIQRRAKQVTAGKAKPRPKRTIKEPGKRPLTTGVPKPKFLPQSPSLAEKVAQELHDEMVAANKEKEKREKEQRQKQNRNK